jgi:hypothetical protein
MPANYVLLEKITVGATGATSVTFSGIPQTGYTDLVVKISGRTNRVYGEDQFIVRFNSDTGNNYAYRFSQAYDAAAATNFETGTNTARFGMISAASSTANSFGNAELYIPNYTSSAYKSISSDSVAGNSGSPVGMWITSAIWTNTAAINSIFLDAANGTEFLQNSTFYLYGVVKLGTTPAIVPYATGGDTIMTDGTYWYHAFKSSGTFTPQKAISCDYLVVAGGGGGGKGLNAGGGGAGGLRSTVTATCGGGSLESALSLASETSYTVTVGAGGAGGVNNGDVGFKGSNSVFSTITSTGGGFGGAPDYGTGYKDGGPGGSGGGGGLYNTAGGAATPSGQGYAGGASVQDAGGVQAGGGGGAGAVGTTGRGTGPVLGTGGAGLQLTAFSTPTGTGASGYYAGGGGGGANAGVAAGGAGGGATAGTSATANTGGGGGGAGNAGGNVAGVGGSGIVIVRYAV